MKEWSESRRVDSSLADWAATFWLINEPNTAQVTRKSVTEKSARRVRGAIGFLDLEGTTVSTRAADGDHYYPAFDEVYHPKVSRLMLQNPLSCRTGPLRVGRPLRGGYTGLGGTSCTGSPVGRGYFLQIGDAGKVLFRSRKEGGGSGFDVTNRLHRHAPL